MGQGKGPVNIKILNRGEGAPQKLGGKRGRKAPCYRHTGGGGGHGKPGRANPGITNRVKRLEKKHTNKNGGEEDEGFGTKHENVRHGNGGANGPGQDTQKLTRSAPSQPGAADSPGDP